MFIALALAASGAAAALLAAELRAGANDAAGARRLRIAALALLMLSAAISILPLRWGWIALLLILAHGMAGFVLRTTTARSLEAARTEDAAAAPPQSVPAHAPSHAKPGGDFFKMAWGGAAGALTAAYVGAAAGIAYLLVLDRFVSTWLPSLSGRAGMLGSLLALFAQFALAGAVVGTIAGWRRPRLRSHEIAGALAAMIAAFFVAHAVCTFLIEVPGFQEMRLLGAADPALILTSIALWLLRMGGTILAGLIGIALAGRAPDAPALRIAAAGLAALAMTPGTIGLYTGRLSYDAMLGGMLLERVGRPEAARRLYALGLAQHSEGEASSYLQFRLAMVHRRLGHDEEAKEALRRLVTRHDKRRQLVGLAEQYLDAWDRAPKGARRVVLPGVEGSTEFKAAYCVPNSLSLVMRYWGVDDSAKAIGQAITMVDFGTGIEDAVWYARDRGLRHFLLPMSSVDDIKGLIDEGMPALIYIPQHVLAVIGYDEAFDSLVAYDVATEEIWVDHPISELLPQWKGEKAVISLVMPEERFQRLSSARKNRLESGTRAYLHYLLHHSLHFSDVDRDQRLALAHLKAAMAADPSQFYVAAHIFSRDAWGEAPRRELAAGFPLPKLMLDAFAFMRRDFDDDETMREISISALDLGQRREVTDFLEQRRRDGTLSEHDGLIETLGAIELEAGRAKEAASTLGTQHYGIGAWLLARALEQQGGVLAAADQYRRVLWGSSNDLDDEETEHRAFGHRRSGEPPVEKDHALRRAALERLRTLGGRKATDADLKAAAAYSGSFPWDAEGQAYYAELAAERLGATGTPAHEKRASLRRLRLAAMLASAVDPDGEAGRRARAAAQKAGADLGAR
jgi:hypothetical protein